MRGHTQGRAFKLLISGIILLASACGGETKAPTAVASGATIAEPTTTTPVGPTPQPTGIVQTSAFETNLSTTRFLTQATFGPRPDDVERFIGTDAADWFQAELRKQPTRISPIVSEYLSNIEGVDGVNRFRTSLPTLAFWRNAIEADDQLRQRMAFALSEILVVSGFDPQNPVRQHPDAMAYYQDILIENAFGNYRDILEEVTYSPAMGEYLTYRGNQKEDPSSGRMPDENYAREFLQLFTVGLFELNSDGTIRLNGDGNPIELYDNRDITELAKVFTGLDVEGGSIHADSANRTGPMIVRSEQHSNSEKSFLGLTISEGTPLEASIDLTLDHIMQQESMAPFIARQLIQRFTTSDPDPDYVERVAAAFSDGSYQFSNGDAVGTRRKGDLSATLAAILFDPDASYSHALSDARFGKIREPIIRTTNWARAFDANAQRPELILEIWDTTDPRALHQTPYRAPSVFNFYRPDYIAPGTETGGANMTVPELQVANASSVPGYLNYIEQLIRGRSGHAPTYVTLLGNTGYTPDAVQNYFYGDYSTELELADDAAALVDHLDRKLAYGQLGLTNRDAIVTAIEGISTAVDTTSHGLQERVHFAILLIMAAPEYLVQN